MFFKKVIIYIKKRRVTQYLVYYAFKALFCTYRIKIIYPTKNVFPRHGIFYCWHQDIIPGASFFLKNKFPGHCIISPSDDGKFIGFLAKKIGFSVIYGSSTKQPIKLIRKTLTILKNEKKLFLIGDGSRGPAKKLQPGIRYFAKKSQLPLFFLDCAVSWKITLQKSWDKFQIPLPWSKIYITVHQKKGLQ